ncbi:hypothetical protein [Streptomyces sp. NPDC001635]
MRAGPGRGPFTQTGSLPGSGRTADVYEIDGAWVPRRYRDGWGDAAAEAVVMDHVRGRVCPAPGVRTATRGDLVMEKLSGPARPEAMLHGRLGPQEAGELPPGRCATCMRCPPATRRTRPSASSTSTCTH